MASTYATVASKGTFNAIPQNATIERDVTAELLIENADPSFKNSKDIKRSFSKAFPKKKLMYAFRTTRSHVHLEFPTQEESKENEELWKSTFLGTYTTCRWPRKLQKNHSLIIKDVTKEDVFTDIKMTALLQESFPDATARRFAKKRQKYFKYCQNWFSQPPRRGKSNNKWNLSKRSIRPSKWVHWRGKTTKCPML